MSKLATTHLGTSFETHCSRLLRDSLGMNLSRIGGKGDGGVDLRGWWYLPRIRSRSRLRAGSQPASGPGDDRDRLSDDRSWGRVVQNETTEQAGRRLRVLVQCKAEKIKAGPRLIREMEGVARRGFDVLREQAQEPTRESPYAIPDPDDPATTASGDIQTLDTISTVICTRAGFSSSAVVEAVRSRVPMLLLHVPFEVEDAIRLIAWQKRQEEMSEDERTEEETRYRHPYPIESVLRAAFWNPALVGNSGVLGEDLELRKEYAGTDARGEEAFGMGLWWR